MRGQLYALPALPQGKHSMVPVIQDAGWATELMGQISYPCRELNLDSSVVHPESLISLPTETSNTHMSHILRICVLQRRSHMGCVAFHVTDTAGSRLFRYFGKIANIRVIKLPKNVINTKQWVILLRISRYLCEMSIQVSQVVLHIIDSNYTRVGQ